MLAPMKEISEFTSFEPVVEPEYNGFPEWRVLMTNPNHEVRAADLLKRVNVAAYVPLFQKQSRRARGVCYHRLCPVLPCMLFVPTDYLIHRDRDRILDWAGVRLLKSMRPVTKAEVDVIRDVEARANKRSTRKVASLSIGMRVRFFEEKWAHVFGEGSVFEIASENRIGVLIPMLFGRSTKVYVPATEIEAI